MDGGAWWAAVYGVAKLTYLILAVLSLHCCVWSFLVAASRDYSPVVTLGFSVL